MSDNEPTDSRLYQKVKSEAKRRFDVWPSAYASGWLVKEYKRQFSKKHGSRKSPYHRKRKSSQRSSSSQRGGGGDLERWFQEDWRNVCERDSRGRYKKCGRRKSSGSYPYCRPRKRVSSKTPKTIDELSSAELKRMCGKKREAEKKRDPRKKSPSRVYLSRGSKGSIVQKRRRQSKTRSRKPSRRHRSKARSRKTQSRQSRSRTRSKSSPSKSLQKCVGRKIPILMGEGYPQKQAIAIAYSMCRRKSIK